jgi:hypothetical protein
MVVTTLETPPAELDSGRMRSIDSSLISNSVDPSVAWPAILVTGVVSVAVSFITAWLTFEFVKKREMAENLRLDTMKERDDRIRAEVIRWADPILESVKDIRRRIDNILRHQGYAALHPEYAPSGQFSISYEYFMTSSLYYFGEYFSYALALRNSLSFELFRGQDEKDKLLKALASVESAFGAYPPHYECFGEDRQVFTLQQRSMGSLLLSDKDGNRCISYPKFCEALEDESYAAIFSPLKDFLERLTPSPGDCRWMRLETVDVALAEVDVVCQKILGSPQNEAPS